MLCESHLSKEIERKRQREKKKWDIERGDTERKTDNDRQGDREMEDNMRENQADRQTARGKGRHRQIVR